MSLEFGGSKDVDNPYFLHLNGPADGAVDTPDPLQIELEAFIDNKETKVRFEQQQTNWLLCSINGHQFSVQEYSSSRRDRETDKFYTYSFTKTAQSIKDHDTIKMTFALDSNSKFETFLSQIHILNSLTTKSNWCPITGLGFSKFIEPRTQWTTHAPR